MTGNSSKTNARYVAAIAKQHGCSNVFISPGSRNAPLITSFTKDEEYKCVSIPDERVCAFTALGACIAKNKPVAIICSSGSAVVNFYPAVVEAYYQKLPLIVISADRPKEWIDQGIGQAIRQDNVFDQHIVKSVSLTRESGDSLSNRYNQRLINEAFIASENGPVHINIPFEEPLYDMNEDYEERAQLIKTVEIKNSLSPFALKELGAIWNDSPKVLILAGQMSPNDKLKESLEALNAISPFLILYETVSNLNISNGIGSIDRLINTIGKEEEEEFIPDLLITIGGEVVSKMIKKLLRKPSIRHWHIGAEVKDTFLNMEKLINLEAELFFDQIKTVARLKPEAYRDKWLNKHHEKGITHKNYVSGLAFSDFKAIYHILGTLSSNDILHCANSTSIRYTQLFDFDEDIKHYANRGTSGIDGCTSTAIGHAMMVTDQVNLISGDIAFLYDSNAFWNDELPSNLRIFVLNNNGGNIFRIIQGPVKDANFERYQETHHEFTAEGIALTYGIKYLAVRSEAELKDYLEQDKKDGLEIVEIFTSRIKSPDALKNYFEYLREHNT